MGPKSGPEMDPLWEGIKAPKPFVLLVFLPFWPPQKELISGSFPGHPFPRFGLIRSPAGHFLNEIDGQGPRRGPRKK
jgi:hypothetical protein